MTFPHTFATATSPIPSSYLDDNFNACVQIANIVASLSSNGYVKIPNSTGNNLIIQWGTATTASTGIATFTFPVALSNAVVAAYANYTNAGNLAYFAPTIKTSTKTTTTAYMSDPAGSPLSGATVQFLVFGY